MSEQQTSPSTPAPTSSPESADGSELLTLPVFRQTSLFGLVAAPASPSPAQAPNEAPQTSDTSGLSGADSLTSASLQSSLESRLRARLDGRGSPLYALTWKHWAMSSGPPICALRGRGHRTSAKGSGSEPFTARSWQTPKACDGSKEDCTLPAIYRRLAKGKRLGLAMEGRLAGWPTATARDSTENARHGYMVKGHAGTTMVDAARLSGWPTPNTPNGGRGLPKDTVIKGGTATSKGRKVQLMTHHIAALSGWPTCRAEDAESSGARWSRGKFDTLTAVAMHLSGWPTPLVDSFRSRGGKRKHEMGLDQLARTLPEAGPARLLATGLLLTGSSAGMPSGGRLNPAHSRWLMGYPQEWDACAPTEMPSPRKSQRRSSKASSKRSSKE